MINIVELIKVLYPQIILSIFVWLTYFYTIKCGWVIDDQESFPPYDGKLKEPKYGSIIKWIRYHIVGGNQPSKHKHPETKQRIPCGKVPYRHHALSIILFNLSILATYPWLEHFVGQKIALLSLLLLIAHPITVQSVGWISGIGYVLSLLWMSLSIDCILFFQTQSNFWVQLTTVLSFGILQFLMVEALVATAPFFLILIFMGFYPFAAISFIVCLYLGMGVVRDTWKLRKGTFVDQDMKRSTFFKPRKLIVAFKTFAYYCKLTLWPHKLGLYHPYGYHYDEDIEREDIVALCGFLILTSLIVVFILTEVFAIKLAIAIFILLMLGFVNFITVQQFIAERYIFLPTFGTCILLAYLTSNYIPVFTAILAGYWVRTLLHLPTYDTETRFYESNIWNFPNFEIPYGNYGCAMLKLQKTGMAMDSWKTSAEINPDYDVPNYNIFSNYKANAMMVLQNGDTNGALKLLREAEPYLKRCIESKTCHFKELWTKEYLEVISWLKNPSLLLEKEKDRLSTLEKELTDRKSKSQEQKDIEGIDISLNDIAVRLQMIDKVLTNERLKCASSQQAATVLSPSTSAQNLNKPVTK